MSTEDISEDIVDGKFVGGGELNTNKDFAGIMVCVCVCVCVCMLQEFRT